MILCYLNQKVTNFALSKTETIKLKKNESYAVEIMPTEIEDIFKYFWYISSLIPYWKASCANCTAARQHDSSVMQSLEATTCEVRTAQRLFLALPGDSGAHFPTNKNVLKVNNGSSRNR